MSQLKTTPLDGLHRSLGAKMVPFAGYEMPVQYSSGVLKEHLHTRSAAGLFDVSHMGQIEIRPRSGDLDDAKRALERLMPVSVLPLKTGRQRYGLLTNDQGGIMDDVMFADLGDRVFLVANASRKESDLEILRNGLTDCDITVLDRGLIALQGPGAEAALATLNPAVKDMKFMDIAEFELDGVNCLVSRAGYTGEDGFEVSMPVESTEALTKRLLDTEGVEPIGLGARDSLRLEAGLCLYGNDIDETTTPVEAALEWAIQKPRRRGGEREGGFPGAEVILEQLEKGAARRRVGLRPEGRAPMREGVELAVAEGGEPVGKITSGGFGPTLGAPVAMGYVPTEHSAPDTQLYGLLRGRSVPVTVSTTPFVESGYKR